jgi:parallel beta-helix repeat protein
VKLSRSGRWSARWTAPAAAVVALLALLILAAPVAAKSCGGATPCECGDTVVASTTLDYDIGVCDKSALRVASGVVLNCDGHTITGNDLSNAKFGIELDGVVGAVVKNCRVTKFRRGIRIFAGSDNALKKNESFENKYGIDVAGETRSNLIRKNLVRDNRDEGVHLGSGSERNRIIANELRYNKHENLYLLRSNRNLVKNNVVHHSKASAIYVKHSSRNRFVRNEVRDSAFQLRGESTENVFVGNYLKGNGYLFEAYEEPEGWTYPSANTMMDDCIRKTDFCYRFFGAFDNVAVDARTDGRCAPPDGELMSLEPRGDQEATGNSVDLADQGCNDDPF